MEFQVTVNAPALGILRGSSLAVMNEIKQMSFEFVAWGSGTAIIGKHGDRVFAVSSINSCTNIDADAVVTMMYLGSGNFRAYASLNSKNYPHSYSSTLVFFPYDLTSASIEIVENLISEIVKIHNQILNNDVKPTIDIKVTF